MWQSVLPAYGLSNELTQVQPFGNGLINHTWKIKSPEGEFILQCINTNVFRHPRDIAANIRLIADFLKQYHPGYLFVTPEKTISQEDMVQRNGEGYFRLLPFVKNSHTINVVNAPSLACEAAGQFGKFTRLLANFPIGKLHFTLPDFHNLSLRAEQFEAALQNGNTSRIAQSGELIHFITSHKSIIDTYKVILQNPSFKLRVTHHDTKISNVLFDDSDKGLCVIDLDTVMPGYFISDVGDMLRTYLSPVSEEEKDFSLIRIRDEYFSAIWKGYMSEMSDELSKTEKAHFIYAGKFMIYMQAMRFLTDHINDDVYYGAEYEGHNFVRAGNQVVLLQCLIEKETTLEQMIITLENQT